MWVEGRQEFLGSDDDRDESDRQGVPYCLGHSYSLLFCLAHYPPLSLPSSSTTRYEV